VCIQVWHIKYKRLFWRPVTAINQGDGTNAADPTWTPFLATPPHPECVAFHHNILFGVARGVVYRELCLPHNCFCDSTVIEAVQQAPSMLVSQ
jgi:hypothetical protein